MDTRLRYRPLAALGFCFCLMMAPLGRGQGLLVDRRPEIPIAGAFDVREVVVDARVREQVSEIQVSQRFHNPSSNTIEAEYLFPVPQEGAIQSFVLLVDGKELPGELLPREKARRIYEEIVRRKRDPALLEYMGDGLIKTSVFPIPPGADRTVTMRYTKLLDRDHQIMEFRYPFGTQKFTAKPIERLELTVELESNEPIKSVYSPSHAVDIDKDDAHSARIRFVDRDTIPTRDFRLFYSVKEGPLSATVLSYRESEGEDGYFLLLASPDVRKEEDAKKQPKTIVFVLDRSGSMSGKKIEQARDALKFVLNNLNENDRFNIVVFDDRVETYKPELQRYGKDARSDALRFVENIRPGGSTNIDGALKAALEMLGDEEDPQYVLFLTDGLPTAGETNEMKIASGADSANKQDARIFPFGVGFDVNARLLDRLSGQNSGISTYVSPDDDIERSVASFYERLTSPVLTDLKVRFAHTDINRTYPRDLPDLFEGGQLVWVGRYSRSGEMEVEIQGKVGRENQTFSFDADLDEAGEGTRYQFVQTLWAVRRVGHIIDQIDLHGPNQELTDELVDLSRRYGILTPYTAFLADENTDLHARVDNRRLTTESLSMLDEVSGSRGVGQRDNKAYYAGALVPQSGAVRGEARIAQNFDADAFRRLDRAGGLSGPPSRPGATPAPALEAAQALKRSSGAPVVVRDAEGKSVVVASVRQIGEKTFYLREGRWIDSELKAEEIEKAKVLEQFSADYFELIRGQSAQQNQYLIFQEPVVVKLGKDVYRIEPPSTK